MEYITSRTPWRALAILLALTGHVEAQEARIRLEEPVDGKVASGITNIRGWAIASQGIEVIEIFLDGQFAFEVPYGGERKDVESAYPDVTGSLKSGFGQTLNYASLSRGAHTVTARAITSTGVYIEDTAQFTVSGLPKEFYPEDSSPSLRGATVSIDADQEEIVIQNLTVSESEPVRVVLAWQVASQSFQIQRVGDDTDESLGVSRTDPIGCDYADTTTNNQASLSITSTASWACDEVSRDLVANGIPDHEVGTFPNRNNPNTISAQTVRAALTLTPRLSDVTTFMGCPTGTTGYVLNGVKIDAGTAGSCFSANNCSLSNPRGSWHIEALGQPHFDFGDDFNHAHVQPGGAYHYHGIPEGFLTKIGALGADMALIGWAADGFPIYARWGYNNPQDARSGVKVIRASYELVQTVPADRPSTDLYQLGTFAEDWQYRVGSGDLDQCNGRFGVTPEFPLGIYHYYATDTYPYFQRCVTGTL